MLNLVPFEPAHFYLLSQWFATQADVVQWGGPLVSFPLTHQQYEGMLSEANSTPPLRLCWMAERHGVLIGHAQLIFDWERGHARLARVVIAPQMRGQGLAKQLVRLVVDVAFAHPEIKHVTLNVYTRNTPAISTYEKLGFKMEGVRRCSVLVDGECWDTVIMGIARQS